jgi:hypothetical protein
MEPTAFPQFTELPPELQLEILEANPEALRRTGRVSSTIRQLAQTSLARHYCDDPINQREFESYLATQPKTMGIWIPIITPDLASYEIYRFFPTSDSCFVVRSDVDVGGGRGHHQVDLRFNWENEITETMQGEFEPCSMIQWQPTGELDLETQYQILSRRRLCVEYDPNYAQNQVLNTLESIYNRKDTERVVDVAEVFLILANNALIIQTPTTPPSIHYRFNVDDEGLLYPDHQIEEYHYNELVDFIETMYGEIREHFLGPESSPNGLTHESPQSEIDDTDESSDND